MNPPIFLYNTLARKKEPLRTEQPDRVTMYVCGPTVYNYAHIGNARPAVVFDVETDGRHREPQQQGQRQSLPPGGGHEDQQVIEPDKASQNERRLQVHLRAITLRPSGAAEIFLDPAAQLPPDWLECPHSGSGPQVRG